MDIDKEDLIEIIKECIAYMIWESEQCYTLFSNDNIERFNEIIENYES